MPTMTFDDYTNAAPQDSERWATSARGWLYDERGDCRGFYLTYEAGDHVRDVPYVFATVYDRTHPGTGVGGTTNERCSRWATVAEAQAWMLAEHGAALETARVGT
jgi:hypothetical protein